MTRLLTTVCAGALALTGLLAAGGGAACGASPDDESEGCTTSADCPDGGICADGRCEACSFGLPPPNDPCLPVCGNPIGVGQPCTAGGGECNAFLGTGAGLCTIDFVPDAPLHMCTRPCADDTDCGADAVCQRDPDDPDGSKGCVPTTCVGS